MSNPTSNFGWQMPTPTDLVTDLPADFEVFGQAVDSTMADLKGGTTGQMLTKATNTDMDFTWVTPQIGDITAITATSPLTGGGTSGDVTVGIQAASTSQSGAVQLTDSTSSTSTTTAATPNSVKSSYDLANGAIPKSTVTGKGSIVAATGSSAPANLAVGNNGETLVADSSTSTGLRYTAGNPIANPVLNSCFDIWQRGTSILATASVNAYQADRWQGYSASGNITVSRQATGDTTNLPNIQYCARSQRTSGNTSVGAFALTQSFESTNSIPFAGKTVTLSFYARAGANYSSASSVLNASLTTGTGTDQNLQGGYTGATTPLNQNATLTTTWQRFTYTATLAATATELALSFSYTPVGTAGANDYFEITGVQLDIGSVALPVRRNGATLQGELAACQRYYWRTTTTNGGLAFGNGSFYTTTAAYLMISNPVPMRIKSTSIDYTGLVLFDGSNNITVTSLADITSSSITSAVNVNFIQANVASGGTQYRPVLMWNNTGTGYLGFNAEL